VIKTLHVLRGFASLAVVFYHLDIPLPGGNHTDLFGVAIFFTISGFLMCLTTEKTVDKFMLKRVLRVLPVYWVAIPVTLLWYGTGLANPFYTVPTLAHMIQSDPGHVAPFIFNNLVASLNPQMVQRAVFTGFLWPKTVSFTPIIGVGWTLTIEMVCYVVFGASIWLSRKYGIIIAFCSVSATFLIGSTLISPDQQLWQNFVYLPPFASGLIAFYLWKHVIAQLKVGRVIFLLMAAVSASVYVYLVLSQVALSGQRYSDYLAGGASLAIVAAALLLERSGVRVANQLFQLLGTISYSLYLIHSQIIDALRTLWENTSFPNPHHTAGGVAVNMGICVLFGLLFYRAVERPLVTLGHKITASLNRSPTTSRASYEASPERVL